MIDPVFDIAFRGAFAALLLSAAWHKLRDPFVFWQAVSGYKLLPQAFERPISRIIPVAEIAIALSLLLFSVSAFPVFAALTLWIFYGGAIAINLLRGRDTLDCGCGGIGADQTIHWGLVLRNSILALTAGFLLLPVSSRALGWFDYATAGFAVLLLLLIYATAEHLLRNAALLGHEGTHP
ncbi:MAG: methylamine utilization protein MauE [Parvibaculaceae bacterium]|nr:methylamine utilization protein MauE [Parvibaculaceae bacterium]HBM87223.1 methylamine utilization protein MauE [Rhodobiaceae bacterium]